MTSSPAVSPAPIRTVARAAQHCQVQPDAEAPGRLRAWVSALLDDWLLPHLKEDLALIATELASNAVRHGDSPAHATLSIGEYGCEDTRVRLEVTDGGPGFDPQDAISTWDDSGTTASCHGRGLLLVAALSKRWGSLRLNPGQRVWAELATD